MFGLLEVGRRSLRQAHLRPGILTGCGSGDIFPLRFAVHEARECGCLALCAGRELIASSSRRIELPTNSVAGIADANGPLSCE